MKYLSINSYMVPELFKLSKYVFIIFPPGAGGNHLANLLSCHPEFEPRWKSKNYIDELIDTYYKSFAPADGVPAEDITTHFAELQNLQPDRIIHCI